MATTEEAASELFVEIGGVAASLRVPVALRAPLAARLSGPSGPPPSAASVRYRVTTESADRYGLERDHGAVRHHVDGTVALDTALADLADVVHRKRPNLVLARAGAVEVDGRGIVILGSPGAGTSALVRALVEAGAALFSDGLAAFDRFGRLHPVVLAGDAQPNAGAAVEVPEPVPVSLVVSTGHDPAADWDPLEIRGARAVLGLLEHVVANQQQAPAARALLGNLAPHVVQLRGDRPEADDVAVDLIVRAGQLPLADLPTPPEDDHADLEGDEVQGMTRPARFLRFDDLLTADEHRRLLDHTLSREAEFAPSEVLTDENVDDQVVLRRSQTIFDLDEIWDLFQDRLVGLLPHIRRELDIGWFDLGPIERQLTVHGDGDHFTFHVDNSGPEVAARIVSAVYYFNREPQGFSGGELRLFDTVEVDGSIESADTFTEVVPTDNTLVVFPSEVPHEVRPVHVPGDDFADRRFTIVFWARRAVTPVELFTGDADRLAALQHELLPALTTDGIRVVPTPVDIQARLAGIFEAEVASAPAEDADHNILPTGTPTLIDLGEFVPVLHDELRAVHEDWYGAPLEPTFAYGLRVYGEGQTLNRHTDKFETHVISSVVHVAADVDEPWPLVIEDSDGESRAVFLEPGQMLLYEGAKLPHSRPTPLRGRHYASVFLHYRPLDWPRTLARVCREAGRPPTPS